MKHISGRSTYPLEGELYNLKEDTDERNNPADSDDYQVVREEFTAHLTDFFAACSDPHFDLWKGGTVKSNCGDPGSGKMREATTGGP